MNMLTLLLYENRSADFFHQPHNSQENSDRLI